MSNDEMTRKLEREPAKVECPICRHRQWFATPSGRCEHCGSEVTLYVEREAAEHALDALVADGRVAFLARAKGVYAVVANRSFGGKGRE